VVGGEDSVKPPITGWRELIRLSTAVFVHATVRSDFATVVVHLKSRDDQFLQLFHPVRDQIVGVETHKDSIAGIRDRD
jgi:hypothetical protein